MFDAQSLSQNGRQRYRGSCVPGTFAAAVKQAVAEVIPLFDSESLLAGLPLPSAASVGHPEPDVPGGPIPIVTTMAGRSPAVLVLAMRDRMKRGVIAETLQAGSFQAAVSGFSDPA
jgi:hypothetical protein